MGRRLVEAAEAWARAQGCLELASDAEADNDSSAAAHRALGFTDVGLIRCFRKDLAPAPRGRHQRPWTRRDFLAAAGALRALAGRRAAAAPGPPGPRVDTGALDLLRAAGVDGSFVLLDLGERTRTLVNPDQAVRPYLPASTFKIPNTLIGLETGVIPDEHFALKWDGVQRARPAWNRDHDLESAMRNSVVWFYQEVARRIGPDRMRRYLERLRYGNEDISGGVDRFWLSGGLRISPVQQVDFLKRLVLGELPVKPRSRDIVRRILPSAEAEGTTLRWKTGLTRQGALNVGWVVGFTEGRRRPCAFATLVLTPQAEDADMARIMDARTEVALRLLTHMGVVPPDMQKPS